MNSIIMHVLFFVCLRRYGDNVLGATDWRKASIASAKRLARNQGDWEI